MVSKRSDMEHMCNIVKVRNYLLPRSLKIDGPSPQIQNPWKSPIICEMAAYSVLTKVGSYFIILKHLHAAMYGIEKS